MNEILAPVMLTAVNRVWRIATSLSHLKHWHRQCCLASSYLFTFPVYIAKKLTAKPSASLSKTNIIIRKDHACGKEVSDLAPVILWQQSTCLLASLSLCFIVVESSQAPGYAASYRLHELIP